MRGRFGNAVAVSVGLLTAVAGCGVMPRSKPFDPEQFGSTTTHSRDYVAAGASTCEAARRALLSQGYVITLADADHVNGKKNFQPEPEAHVEVEFHVVCAPANGQGTRSIAFVNALQDRYALKKSNNSASLGVGVLGSVSLPFSSSDDAMVRVASETITSASFYERFFALLDRYLAADTLDGVVLEVKQASPAASTPSPTAAPPIARTPVAPVQAATLPAAPSPASAPALAGASAPAPASTSASAPTAAEANAASAPERKAASAP